MWWYAIFMIGDQSSGFGRSQLMLSWTSFRGGRYCLDDEPIPLFDIDNKRGRGRKQRFGALALGWYFSGTNLTFPTLKLCGPLEIEDSGLGGAILVSTEEGGSAQLRGNREILEFNVSSNGFSAAITGEISGDNLHSLALDQSSFSRLSPISALRIRRFSFKGAIQLTEHGKQAISGFAYLQRVAVRGPLPPWRWMYAVFADGSVAGFSAIYISGADFVQSGTRGQVCVPALGIPLMTRGYFYEAAADRLHRFAFAKLEETDQRSGIWIRMFGDGGEDHLSLKLRFNEHVSFEITSKILSFKKSALAYSARIAEVVDISGQVRGRDIAQGQFGPGYANFEHPSGILF
jgi:hypothetical protein